MEAKGHTGTVLFDGKSVIIRRKGFVARASVGKGEKNIPVKSISAVQWKPAGIIMNGYIEFSIAGGVESKSALGSATSNAVSNENAVVFTKKQMPLFEELRTAIEVAINSAHSSEANSNIPIATSINDRMKDLNTLHESGLITLDEYNKKKEQLLDSI